MCVFVCAQLHLTLFDPVDCSPSSSFAHGIFQARILEQAISTPEDLLNSGIEPYLLHQPALASGFFIIVPFIKLYEFFMYFAY